VTWVRTVATPGSLIETRVTAVQDDYDFTADFIRPLDMPVVARVASARGRALPVAPTIGSFGR